jgi:zinc/manganese transport system substrate-binding protein
MRTRTKTPWRAIGLVVAWMALAAPGGAAGEEAVRVVTTIPVLGDLARTVGGSRVTVVSLSDPRQNPHYVEPRPTLMRRSREADLFIEVGIQLEPWARRVIAGSGNPRIQPGQPGHVIASLGVSTLEVPQRISRDLGSIHPFGNPYIWLDPLNVKRMATNVADGLVRVDPAHEVHYRERLAAFHVTLDEALFGPELVAEIGGAKLDRLTRQGRLQGFLEQRELTDKLGGWLCAAEALRGRPVVSHHKTWVYFAERFGFSVLVEIEEKPGILPSSRHRARVLELMRENDVRSILIETYQDRRTADELAQKAGANVVAVPIDVDPEVKLADYVALIDHLIESLVESEQGG